MIRYYKLFDILNRRDMKLSDLRTIVSSATVAKLRKGEYISGEVIEKICIFLKCQPGDIMEVITDKESVDENTSILYKSHALNISPYGDSETETILERIPTNLNENESDELGLTERYIITTEIN